MGEAMFFSALSLLFFSASLYFGELLLFCHREKTALEKNGKSPEYWDDLRARYRKTKRKRKKHDS